MSNAFIYIVILLAGVLTGFFIGRTRKNDGVMNIEENEGKVVYQLVLYSDIEDLPRKKYLIFKVKK